MSNAHQYLSCIRVMRKKLDRKIERYNEAMQSADGLGAIRYDKDPVQTSVTDSMIENTVIDYVDLEQQINDLIQKLNETIARITEEIRRMPTEDYKRILISIYLDQMSCEDVADQMGCSRWTIYRLKGKALREFTDTNPRIVS